MKLHLLRITEGERREFGNMLHIGNVCGNRYRKNHRRTTNDVFKIRSEYREYKDRQTLCVIWLICVILMEFSTRNLEILISKVLLRNIIRLVNNFQLNVSSWPFYLVASVFQLNWICASFHASPVDIDRFTKFAFYLEIFNLIYTRLLSLRA